MGVEYSGQRATPRLDLGAAIYEFMQDVKDFIGTQVFPVFDTKLKKSTYPAITRESITQVGDTKRAMRGNYNRGGIGAKDKSYSCEENGWESPLDDSERALYATDFDAELASSKIALSVVLRNQEKRIADRLFDTGVFTGSDLFTDNSANPWTDVSKDPILQVRAAKGKIRANCGMLPNALIMSYANLERLKGMTVIKDAIKYVARTTDQELANALADLFGMKYIFVGNAIKNASKEGKAFTSADIWSSNYVSLAVVAEDPKDLTQPAVGRTFLWTADCPENAYVEQYRDETIRSEVYRVRQHTDEKLIDPYFAHLMKVA